jgi:predicted transposase YbfD/YdcC
MIWAPTTNQCNEVFRMDAITFTVMPRGTDTPIHIDLTALLAHLQQVPDQRKRRGVRYPLAVLLTIAVLAKLCGDSQVHAIADWAHERRVELARVFGLTRPRMPHPTTWTRVLGYGVAACAIEAAVAPLLQPPASAEVPARASDQIAVDGKTLRGTIPNAGQGVHLLSAYQVGEQVVLGQVAVGTKANELTVAPSLLAGLALESVLVTGDAMFAQRHLSIQIVEAGGDYCWVVKENQKTLYEDLRVLFGPQPETLPGTSQLPDDFVSVRTVEKAHGRLDERVLTTSEMLRDYHDWPYLAQAFQVVRTSVKGRRCTREVRYGITSAPRDAAPAQRLQEAVRDHWQIENGLHYRRDVTLNEDASLARMGQAPHVLATLNNLVCGVIARAGVTNLAALQRALAAAVDRWLFTAPTLH